MKNLKRIFCALLTLVLSFCAVSAVSAAGTGKITVNDATVGKKYEIYKIFDLTLGGNNTKFAYTIDSDWIEFFNGDGAKYIIAENNQEKTLNSITVNGAKKYINITDSNVIDFTQEALDYAATLTKIVDEEEVSFNDGEQTATTSTVAFNNLDLGYYLVYPEGATDIKEGYGSICSLTTTLPEVEVTVKAEYPTIDKTVDDYSVEVGQIVNFTITGKVPDTTGFETYTYEISDTMSAGLLFNTNIANIKVYFGEDNEETEEDEREEITTGTLNIANNGFVLTFDMTDYQEYKDQTITVEYQAKVTKDAIDSTTTKNSATLKYSNDPKNDESFTTNPPVEKYLYSADILVIKVDGTDESIKLAGAKFALKNSNGKYYKANIIGEVLDNIEWVTNIEEATEYTTDANGNVTFAGLEDGTYYLVETEAPEGYNLLVNPITVNVSNTGSQINAVPTIEQVESTVENNSGTQLPTTGGMGTTLFIIIGSLLVIMSAVIFVTNKRIAKEM